MALGRCLAAEIGLRSPLGISGTSPGAVETGWAKRGRRHPTPPLSGVILAKRPTFLETLKLTSTGDVAALLEGNSAEAPRLLGDCIARGDNIPAQTIALCLRKSYFAYKSNPRRPPPLAGPLMKHLRADCQRWLPFVSDTSSHATVDLCYFALLEGLERSIQDWCLVDINDADVPADVDYRDRNIWRGSLLGCLITAHFRVYPRDADKAIQCLLKIGRLKDLRRRDAGLSREYCANLTQSGPVSLALWPATWRIIKALKSGKIVSIDAELYDSFERFASSFLRSIQERLRPARSPIPRRNWQKAMLPLHRPDRPDEQEAVQLLRMLDTTRQQVGGTLSVPDVFQQDWLIEDAPKIHEVALKNGNTRDAQWLFSKFGQYFT